VQQPHPTLLIGGGGEKRTLRLVAQYADWCNVSGSVEEVTHKLESYGHTVKPFIDHMTRSPVRLISSALLDVMKERSRQKLSNMRILVGSPVHLGV
jgi:alkanesulfonate monooxygenase SsuD/methylene tetrahydromethanopterin reductase-like flavin-dependent oxidoreductase (luciferase family)